MNFSEVFEKIQRCSKKDPAKNNAEAFLYVAEEFGEVAACISNEIGLKNKNLKETTAEECCDLIVSSISLLIKQGWSEEQMTEYMDKKTTRWESRLLSKESEDYIFETYDEMVK